MGSVNTALQNVIADAVGGAFDDAGGGVAQVEILDGATVVATFNLSADAFQDASNGQITANGMPTTVSASADGKPVDSARIKSYSSGGSLQEQIDGLSVGTTGSEEVVLDNTDINTGQDVTLNSVTITAPSGSS